MADIIATEQDVYDLGGRFVESINYITTAGDTYTSAYDSNGIIYASDNYTGSGVSRPVRDTKIYCYYKTPSGSWGLIGSLDDGSTSWNVNSYLNSGYTIYVYIQAYGSSAPH